MLRFDANLFRIVAGFQSKEETRYYLQGVFIEPHPVKGVTMTAIDGHRMFCAYDEHGAADESAIVQLTPEAFKACKPVRGEDHREVSIEGAQATVLAYFQERGQDEPETGVPVAIATKCRVEGTFPDYRRIVPQGAQALAKDAMPGFFNGVYLGTFGAAAVELEKHFGDYDRTTHGVMRVVGPDAGSPALVLFDKVPHAFGVIMPCRGKDANSSPAWFNVQAESAAQDNAA